MNNSQIIVRPVLTEKSVTESEKGKYTFVVHQDATKVDVRNAMQSLYGVHVTDVNIGRILPKYRMGKSRAPMQKRANERKAIITLKKGEMLDLSKPTK